jgi:hypothetical protein
LTWHFSKYERHNLPPCFWRDHRRSVAAVLWSPRPRQSFNSATEAKTAHATLKPPGVHKYFSEEQVEPPPTGRPWPPPRQAAQALGLPARLALFLARAPSECRTRPQQSPLQRVNIRGQQCLGFGGRGCRSVSIGLVRRSSSTKSRIACSVDDLSSSARDCSISASQTDTGSCRNRTIMINRIGTCRRLSRGHRPTSPVRVDFAISRCSPRL